MEHFKRSSLKVVVFERWSPSRGDRLQEVPNVVINIGGRLQEVVAKGGSTL